MSLGSVARAPERAAGEGVCRGGANPGGIGSREGGERGARAFKSGFTAKKTSLCTLTL